MSAALSWPLGLIVVAVLISVIGTLRHATLSPARKALRCLLQVLVAIAPWLVLFPPIQTQPALSVQLLTSSGATPRSDAGGLLYALPEAGDVPGAQRVPDLASLLRSQPQITAVQLTGDGLPARDRVPQRAALSYTPAPLHGLVEVHLPDAVPAGGWLQLQARVAGEQRAGWQAELRDPAERVVDRHPIGEDSHIALQAPVRAAGQVVYSLRLVDTDNRLIDSAPLPVRVVDGHALRVHQHAGAPNAENKFFQRWASDAGLVTSRQLPTGGGVVLGDTGAGLDARQLANSDLLLLDERSLLALGSGGRARLRSALRDGLGVLVQPRDALEAGHRQALAGLGLRVAGGNRAQTLVLEADKTPPERLDVLRGPRAHTPAQAESAPALKRWNVTSSDARPLRHGPHDIGLWQAVGKGRIGLLALPDTHLLVLAGRDELHAALWAQTTGTLARARAQEDGKLQHDARLWQHERNRLCGLQGDTDISHIDSQHSQHLRIDPTTPGCAAWWPQHAGWHRIGDQAVFVTAADQAAGLHRAQRLRETAEVVAASALPADHALPQQPGPRWPWWLALIGLLGVLWWVERRP